MGLAEYARSIWGEVDDGRMRLVISPDVQYAQIIHDEKGLTNLLPEPTIEEDEGEEKTASIMGYRFPLDIQGRRQLAMLFRASVLHQGAHSLVSNFEDYEEWQVEREPKLATFITSVIEDTAANAYLLGRHPKTLVDQAFANALALKRLRCLDKLLNPATKMMAGFLVRMNTGLSRVRSEQETIEYMSRFLDQFKEKIRLTAGCEKPVTREDRLRIADELYRCVEQAGPTTEMPFLPHTEQLGKCSVFYPSFKVDFNVMLENDFSNCLNFLGGNLDSEIEEHLRALQARAVSAFSSWEAEREKKMKIIAKYEELISTTRFCFVDIPQEDYTRFQSVKSLCKSEAHRLIESLLVARDAIDEDPRKMYGVLDLPEVVQVIASKSPRMDVFMLDENISKSYAWMILLDASRSMEHIGRFALELFVMAGEAANQLLLDPASWGMYAFNDRFLVVKDPTERYGNRVRSRIGGTRFEGLTYMPDALKVASQIMKKRSENLRLITVISDGWPFGYHNIEEELVETIDTLERGNIAVIGIGAKTQRMELFFRRHCTAHTLRDLKKKFSNLYIEASRIALET